MELDSLMAVELRDALSQRVGATLPATLAFDYPTVEALTRWLLEKVLSVKEAEAPRALRSRTRSRRADSDRGCWVPVPWRGDGSSVVLAAARGGQGRDRGGAARAVGYRRAV